MVKKMKIIDISQVIWQDMMVYPGDPEFHSHPTSSFKRGDVCEVSELTIGSHCGTHIDAPLHMIPGGAALESLSLECFIGPCRVIDVHASVISEKYLAELNIVEGERLLLRTDPEGVHQDGRSFNPAVLSMRAAQFLAKRRIRLIGIDSPTIENMELCDGEVHRTLLGEGIAVLEGLRLGNVPAGRYFLSALPLKLDGENGSPCRAVLLKED